MDDDFEMDDFKKDEASTPLLNTPEMAVVQPDQEEQRDWDSPKQEKFDRMQEVYKKNKEEYLRIKEKYNRLQEKLGSMKEERKRIADESETNMEELESIKEDRQSIEEERKRIAEELKRWKEELESIKEESETTMEELKRWKEQLETIADELYRIPGELDRMWEDFWYIWEGLWNIREKLESMKKKEIKEERKGFKKETEDGLNKVLQCGDLENIEKHVTPQNLTNCTTNCIEKSFKVSEELKSLGKSKGSNATEFNDLATQVEDFAYHLLEPLKNDDKKRDTFKEKLFDRVSDNALKYRQKKFLSHPVYEHLMRQQWMGKYSNVKRFKWYLLTFLTFFDVLLFPLVHVLLGVIHLIIEFAKKRQDLSVIFMFDDDDYGNKAVMRKTADYIEKKLNAQQIRYVMIKTGSKTLEVEEITSPKVDTSKTEMEVKDVESLDFEKGSRKVLVDMAYEKEGGQSNELLEAVDILHRKQNVEVISLGIMRKDDHLYHRCTIKEIPKCIKGKDIYDRYVHYFTTPYFIFIRDTLSYLALLGLHFAICLQPSTIHFTAVEWIISVFFFGRFMMEINQVITEEAKLKPTNEKDKKEGLCKKLWKVMSAYFADWWNILDIVTLIVFLLLVGLRIFIWSQHSSISKNRLLAVAGYLYGLNAMFLTLRVFGQMMEYNKSTGSIQIALFQIIGAVFIIFGQFLVATLAFSLAVTKIYIAEVSYSSGKNETSIGLCKSQNGLDCWWSFTNHFAWSLLGFADLTPLQSSDNASDSLAKTLYALFLIMGVLMLMNMMIALLSNTYQQVEDNALYEWSLKKATTIRTYSIYHPVPVPFNIVSLSFILLRHIYRTIYRCRKDKKKTTKKENEEQRMEEENKKKQEEIEEDKEEKLLCHLKDEYSCKYGSRFPMADKMDRVLKEIEDSRKMNRNIAQRVFRYDQKEAQLLSSHGDPKWELKACEKITAVGQRLELLYCQQCEDHEHGARYLHPLSEEHPEFEVLIQEIGKRRLIAIGVVTEDYELKDFPGWKGNTAGYHIDDGRIFDSNVPGSHGRDGDDAMATRGDVIGCKILYDKRINDKLPVSFTLNGREVGKAKLNHSGTFYPYVGIGHEGNILLFKMCPRTNTDA